MRLINERWGIAARVALRDVAFGANNKWRRNGNERLLVLEKISIMSRSAATLLTICLTLSLYSCKKNSDGGDPPAGQSDAGLFISFKLDGTPVKYTVSPEGNMNVVDAGGKYTFSAGALKSIGVAGADDAVLIVSNATAITTGVTYVNYATTTEGFQRAAFSTVSYIDDAGITFLSWGDEFAATGIVSDARINFTDITDTNIKGTFSGTAYESISGSAAHHVLTEGKFNVKRK